MSTSPKGLSSITTIVPSDSPAPPEKAEGSSSVPTLEIPPNQEHHSMMRQVSEIFTHRPRSRSSNSDDPKRPGLFSRFCATLSPRSHRASISPSSAPPHRRHRRLKKTADSSGLSQGNLVLSDPFPILSSSILPSKAELYGQLLRQLRPLRDYFQRLPPPPLEEVLALIEEIVALHATQEEIVAQFVSDVFKEIPPYQEKSLIPLLLNLFLKPHLTSFFSHLMHKSHGKLDEYASVLIQNSYVSKNIPLLIERIIAHSQCDLIGQTPSTLNREISFSSLLCKQFGICFSGKTFELFYEIVRNQLDLIGQEHCVHLCFEPSHLRLMYPEKKEEEIESLSQMNTGQFVIFARLALDEFYKTSLSPVFCNLLAQRRAICQQFLSEQLPPSSEASSSSAPIAPHLEQSRRLIAEIPFLRIVNPGLSKLGRSPIEQYILVSLGKILNQIVFENPPSNPELLALYHSFIYVNREWVDRNTSQFAY